MKVTTITLIAAALLLATGSCNKFVDTPIPVNSIVPEEVFSNDASATSALLGGYASVQNVSADLSLNTDLFGDDIMNPNASSLLLDMQENTYSPNTNFSFFDNYYRAIYVANSLVEGLDEAKALTAATKQQLKGESLFLRAFCHFQLMNLYGRPPLILSTAVKTTALLPNTDRETLFNAIIADLQQARDLVADTYPSDDRVRANKAVVNAFLARVYLYHHQWTEAAATASLLLANSDYTLGDDLNTLFQKDSKETIWQIWNQNGYTSIAGTYIPTRTDNVIYTLRPSLLQAFETGDKRRDAWVRQGTGNSASLYYPYKYRQVASGGTIEYMVQLRLAEQYLIRAEAKAQLNDISGALDDVNTLRTRAGLPPAAAGSIAAALLVIEQERRIELMTENGSRWFDLVRTGRADHWMQLQKPATWQLHDTILPYSTPQLLANPNLQQNGGY